ncbi:MAG: hypothetical protein ACK5O2_04050 [Microthrixaceae bacterium]
MENSNIERGSAHPDGQRPSLNVTTVGCIALCVPAVIAAGMVLGIADSAEQANVLGDAALTFVVWLAAPLMFTILRSKHRPLSAVVLGTAVVAALATVFTLWLTRPQAPDGSDHPYTYDEAVSEVANDVTGWLTQVANGEWSEVETSSTGTPCEDRFGRDRGAVYGGPRYEVNAVFTSDQVAELERAVARPDREVQAVDFGRPEALLGQHHDQIVIRLNTFEDQGASTIEVVTPCLRAE